MSWNRAWIGIALGLCAAAGCSNAHEAGGNDGGTPGDGGAGVACGRTTCALGQVCCNVSCGICTAPGEGCIALICDDTDAGSGRGPCGGLGNLPCAANEYCDFPDGSFCGGDDSTGVCTPRPTDCPEPGGIPVCGCDGTEYLGECSAYLAGSDVAHLGSCATPAQGVSATATCGPADGPAWTFLLADGAPMCGGIPTTASLSISVWDELSGATPGTTYTIGGDFGVSQGQATQCPAGGGGPPCWTLGGTFTIESFTSLEIATFSYDLVASDGSHYVGSHVSTTTFCPGMRLCG